MIASLNAEVLRASAAIALGPRLMVLGSGSFWGADSRPLCEAIAADVAAIEALVVVTGGRDGVGLTFGRAFAAARRAAHQPENLFHLLPRGSDPCDSGVTVAAPALYERREVLGRVGDAYLIIEGGPGTEHEATVAAGRGVPLIPLGRTGGHAGELHHRTRCPAGFTPADWNLLNDTRVPHERVVAAVGRLVRRWLAQRAEPSAPPDPAT